MQTEHKELRGIVRFLEGARDSLIRGGTQQQQHPTNGVSATDDRTRTRTPRLSSVTCLYDAICTLAMEIGEYSSRREAQQSEEMQRRDRLVANQVREQLRGGVQSATARERARCDEAEARAQKFTQAAERARHAADELRKQHAVEIAHIRAQLGEESKELIQRAAAQQGVKHAGMVQTIHAEYGRKLAEHEVTCARQRAEQRSAAALAQQLRDQIESIRADHAQQLQEAQVQARANSAQSEHSQEELERAMAASQAQAAATDSQVESYQVQLHDARQQIERLNDAKAEQQEALVGAQRLLEGMQRSHRARLAELGEELDDLRSQLAAYGIGSPQASACPIKHDELILPDKETHQANAELVKFSAQEIASPNYGPAYEYWRSGIPDCPAGPCCGAGAGLHAAPPAVVAAVRAQHIDLVLRALARMCWVAHELSGPRDTIMRMLAIIPSCSVSAHADASLAEIAREIEVLCSPLPAKEGDAKRAVTVTIRVRPAQGNPRLETSGWVEDAVQAMLVFSHTSTGPSTGAVALISAVPQSSGLPRDVMDGLLSALGGFDLIAASIVGVDLPNPLPVLLCVPPLCKSLRDPLRAYLANDKLVPVPTEGGEVARAVQARDAIMWA